jgi:hypothetical protein
MKGIGTMKCFKVLFAALLCLGFASPGYGTQAEDASQNSGGRSSQNRLQKLESALASARENLRISEATEERIASELERLKNSEEADPEVIADYETYLSRVRDLLLENQKIVRKMEALYAKYSPRTASPSPASATDMENGSNPKVPDEKEYDELGRLDRELDESLTSYDEMLLRELDKIRKESDNIMKDLTEEATAAAERLKKKGIGESATSGEEGTSSEGMSEAGEGKTESEQSAMSPEKGGKETQTATAGNPQGGARGGQGEVPASTQKQPSRPSGYDDDIVARQIREAAEKETDPVLKERLWKEYEDYKKGSRK